MASLSFAASSRATISLTARPTQRGRTDRQGLVVRAAEVDVTETMGPKSRVTLNVKVPLEMAKAAHKELIKEISKEVKIPGFRPGAKVSDKMIISQFGTKQVKSAMVEAVLNKAVPLAIAQVADRALDESEKIETDVEQMAKIFNGPACEPTSDMEFCIGVDLVPEVTWTGNYKDIAVTVEAAGNDTSAANEVARRLAAKHKELSKMGVVADRGLQRGDVAVLDLSAVKLNEDGSEGDEINGVNNKNFRFDTGEGEGFIPGLVEAVVGMTTGETKTFELTFPAAWYIPSMQGVTGKFTATLKELFAYEFAPLDDDLAPQLMDGCTTMDAVRAALAAEVSAETERATNAKIHTAITEQLADLVTVDLPESLVQDQGRQNYSVQMLELLSAGQITQDVLQTMMTEAMVQNYLDKKRDDVERIVRLTLAVGDIQKRENIIVDAAELAAEVANSKAEFDRMGQEYDEQRVADQAKEVLEGGKVLDWLKGECKVEVTPYTGEDGKALVSVGGGSSGGAAKTTKDGAVVFKFD